MVSCDAVVFTQIIDPVPASYEVNDFSFAPSPICRLTNIGVPSWARWISTRYCRPR